MGRVSRRRLDYVPSTYDDDFPGFFLSYENDSVLQLIAKGGNAKGLFNGAMGDSPSLSFVPSHKSAYVQNIFHDFSSAA